MPRPAAVVFDLGKVMLDFDYEKVAANLVEHCNLSRPELVRLLNQSTLLPRYETGLMTTGEFFDEVKRASGFCHGLEIFEPIFGDIFDPVPEMIELNRRLRSSGIPTCIFSNTNEMAVKHIRGKYPFFQEFDEYILSWEHRSMKPNAAIYEVVENRLGQKGANILYIDDRIENIAAGAARGWQIIHHSNPRETIPVVEKLAL